MRRVYIGKSPFLGMIRSALDTLKSPLNTHDRESFNYLYGHILNNNCIANYYIENLQASQIAKRMPGSVEVIKEHDARLEWTISSLEEFIGHYHTHVPYMNNKGFQKAKPVGGKVDEQLFKNFPNNINLIVAINKSNRLYKPVIKQDRIHFSVRVNGDKYHFIMWAYYCDKNSNSVRRALINIPGRVKKEL